MAPSVQSLGSEKLSVAVSRSRTTIIIIQRVRHSKNAKNFIAAKRVCYSYIISQGPCCQLMFSTILLPAQVFHPTTPLPYPLEKLALYHLTPCGSGGSHNISAAASSACWTADSGNCYSWGNRAQLIGARHRERGRLKDNAIWSRPTDWQQRTGDCMELVDCFKRS